MKISIYIIDNYLLHLLIYSNNLLKRNDKTPKLLTNKLFKIIVITYINAKTLKNLKIL